MDKDKLNEVLKQHKLWLGTDGKEGKRANLSGDNLSGDNLSGANLEYADLRGANLWYANLRKADLRGADLRKADLCGADLRGAELCDANLRKADLRGADLCGADLRGACLEYADLWGANLEGVDLRGACLEYAGLWGANLEGVDLRGACLEYADLGDAYLYGAKFDCEKTDPVEDDKVKHLPEDSKERKDIPIYTGVINYFPDAFVELAKLSLRGGVQHGQTRETLHWDRDKSTDHLDALCRHMIDEDWVEVAWRALANLQVQIEKENE